MLYIVLYLGLSDILSCLYLSCIFSQKYHRSSLCFLQCITLKGTWYLHVLLLLMLTENFSEVIFTRFLHCKVSFFFITIKYFVGRHFDNIKYPVSRYTFAYKFWHPLMILSAKIIIMTYAKKWCSTSIIIYDALIGNTTN